MNSLIHFLKYFHRFILIAALVLTAITPIIFNEYIYSFLYLPVILVFLGILSMNIEHWLNKYEMRTVNQIKPKNHRRCLIKQGLCCFHH